MAAKEMKRRHNVACCMIRHVAGDASGGVSGGTIYTGLALSFGNALAEADPAAASARGCYALDPVGGCGGSDVRDGPKKLVEWDRFAQAWVTPFIMAEVNSPVVRKSNALLDYQYGPKCSYSEAVASSSLAAAVSAVTLLALGSVGRVSAHALAPHPIRAADTRTGPEQRSAPGGLF